MPITTVFLDFGKTLHDFHLDYFFNWLSRKFGIERHHFWDVFSRFPDGLLYKYECGEDTRDFIERVRTALQGIAAEMRLDGKQIGSFEFSDEEFVENWNNIFDTVPVLEDRLRLMRGLKKNGYKMYVLSNLNEAQLAYLKSDHRFDEIFALVDRFIASCDPDIQCRKTRLHVYSPHNTNWFECRKIFGKALTVASSTPEEIVYIDDILDYVEVFRVMGGNGIHHTGVWTKVEAELYKLGVRWE